MIEHPTRRILLNPGPVTTSNSVKQALLVPDICHREAEFANLIQSIRHDLLTVIHAQDDYTSILFATSGTGAIEACLSSVIDQQNKVLIINNGSYGQRMLAITERYGITTVELSFPFDQALPISQLEALLKKDTTISHVALVHHETSSGILNPLQQVGAVCHQLNRKLIVDAMSSYAGTPINVYNDHIDYLIASSNKCLHGMPGAAFVIAKIDTLLASEGNARSYYLDLHQQYRALHKEGVFAFTPPVQVLYALNQALHELTVETVAGRIARYHERYYQLVDGLAALGFACVTPSTLASKLLATIQFPNDNMNFEDFHDALYAQGYTIYPKKLAIPQTFRVSCLGELTAEDIDNFLAATQLYCNHLPLKNKNTAEQ